MFWLSFCGEANLAIAIRRYNSAARGSENVFVVGLGSHIAGWVVDAEELDTGETCEAM